MVVVALAAALLLRTFVVQTFYIPSGSMEPTLQIGDRILVNKLGYHLHGVDRGNIVVFRRPAGRELRRPARGRSGQAGDRAPGRDHLAEQGPRLIDGKLLDESWLPASVQGTTFPGPAGTGIQPDQALCDPGQRLLRHGRQPGRFL